MSTPSHPTQRNPALAYVLPLAAFMLLTEAARWFKVENSALPWWQSAPEHWLYPLQCVIVGATLLSFRRSYVLMPWRGLGLAALLAVLGIAVWVAPVWFGWMERDEGFNPNVFAHGSAAWWGTVLMRFMRMVIIVPWVEELFWRGFLMRYVQADGVDWQRVPFGQHSWKAYGIVTALVTLVHDMSDWPAAFVWGSLVYWLAVKTKSLGACVFMHAVGNLLLGFCVMTTQQWGFW
ncbi:MAG: CAAX prenyl protease-related protein [Verrucomicrobiaceae bacterium]